MKYLGLIVSVLLSVICLAEESPLGTSGISVIVQVESGTDSGSSITGDTVTIDIYEHGKALLSMDSVVDANGQAVFENVPAGAHRVFVPGVKHQEMLFGGRAVAPVPGKDTVVAKVQVFNVSEDKSKLSVPIHHIIIEASENTLNISEYMQLKNSSDMAVSSEQVDSQNKSIVLEVMLPRGFRKFSSTSYLERSALVFTEDGFYDTMAVPPGEYSVKFSYILDIDSSTVDFVKKLTLPVSSLVIFTDIGQATLQGLGEHGLFTESSGAQMNYYTLANLGARDEVSFTLTGLDINRFDPATWAIVAVVIGAVVILVFFRMRPEKGGVNVQMGGS